MEQPIQTVWSIRVTNPSKTIEHCAVSIDGTQLPVANGGAIPLETKISVGGAHNFRVPTSINPFGGVVKDFATVTVKDGKRTIKKAKFRDIPIGR